LISSLGVYAKVNGMGFIETPYRKVTNGVVDLESTPIYLSAEEEEDKMIAQANIEIDDTGKITASNVIAREEGDFPVVDLLQVTLYRRCTKPDCFDFGFIDSFPGA
jgi:DNA-directed RNA polymerase subunit beta